jgi:hypothetical protein
MAYEFGKFYTLGKSRGIPVYANGVLITPPLQIVWWWPVNWVAVTAYIIWMKYDDPH